MCLIIVADSARPSASEIQGASLYHSDGIGVAYRQPNDRLVTWQKGLSAEEAIDLVPTLPLPFVVHFRWATHGGTSPLLCHPFPVSRNVGITLTGAARELLFHNGVWSEHVQFERRARLRGPVSDTRVMAYVLWREGQDERAGVATQLASQAGKLALFTPDGITRYGSWEAGDGVGDTTEGCYYSNLQHCWTMPKWKDTGYDHIPSHAGFTGYAYPSGIDVRLTEPVTAPEYTGFTCAGCDEVFDDIERDCNFRIDGQLVCEDCCNQWLYSSDPVCS